MRLDRPIQNALLGVFALLAAATGWSADQPGADLPPRQVTWAHLLGSGSITLYTENDRYFAGTDRHYTNGFKLSFLGDTNLNHSPEFVQTVAKFIPTLPEKTAEEQDYRVGVSIGQNIYTPTEIHTPTPDPADRPYAAWLYGALTFQAKDRKRDLLRVVEFDFGVVGPSAIGEEIQNGVHSLLHIPHAEGWAHQLHDEPGFILAWERRYGIKRIKSRGDLLGADVLGHYGLSLGNVDTSARTGLMARFGLRLPQDFGPDLIRVAGGDTSPATRFSMYFFGSAEGHAVGRNIFLDGNSWRSSPSVAKRPLTADFNYGTVLRFPAHYGILSGLQIAYTQNYRTKEFYGQAQRDAFGSLAVSFLH